MSTNRIALSLAAQFVVISVCSGSVLASPRDDSERMGRRTGVHRAVERVDDFFGIEEDDWADYEEARVGETCTEGDLDVELTETECEDGVCCNWIYILECEPDGDRYAYKLNEDERTLGECWGSSVISIPDADRGRR